jgi:hypothetical protein
MYGWSCVIRSSTHFSEYMGACTVGEGVRLHGLCYILAQIRFHLKGVVQCLHLLFVL